MSKAGAAGAVKVWRDRVVMIVVVWAIWALISTFVVQPFKIPSGSMEKTLGVGDRILVEKWDQGVTRGDVVVFSDPDHWEQDAPTGGWAAALRRVLTATHLTAAGNHLVKRVIGLPGDVVSCDGPDAKLKVNGVAIDEPYLRSGLHGCTPSAGQSTRWRITVPAAS